MPTHAVNILNQQGVADNVLFCETSSSDFGPSAI